MNIIGRLTENDVISSIKTFDEYNISKEENLEIDLFLEELIKENKDSEDPLFLVEALYFANKLPEKIVKEIYTFKYNESHRGVFIIKGYKFIDSSINFMTLDEVAGVTPLSHFEDKSNIQLQKMNLFLVLINSLLGDVFGWSTQHEGRIINNILPVPGNEKEQLSTGSETLLEWHTEEAFHKYRPDVLSLMCVRNIDKIPTTICSIYDIEIPLAIKNILFQKRFIFLSDNNFKDDAQRQLKPEAILYGDYESPYIRIDPEFMKTQNKDFEAKTALAFIVAAIDNKIIDISLNSGDICLLDNQRVVHGRKPFVPKYDGTDRWLKRVIVTRDIRKSRRFRSSDVSRVINTI